MISRLTAVLIPTFLDYWVMNTNSTELRSRAERGMWYSSTVTWLYGNGNFKETVLPWQRRVNIMLCVWAWGTYYPYFLLAKIIPNALKNHWLKSICWQSPKRQNTNRQIGKICQIWSRRPIQERNVQDDARRQYVSVTTAPTTSFLSCATITSSLLLRMPRGCIRDRPWRARYHLVIWPKKEAALANHGKQGHVVLEVRSDSRRPIEFSIYTLILYLF